MKKLLIITGILLIVMQVFAQDGLFTPLETPIVERGDDWDQIYTDPGAVTFHDGQFHMIRNGFNSWVGSVQMGYLVSNDGLNWSQPQDTPVLYTDDVSFAEQAALASSLHVEADGTWVLYFYTWNNANMRNGESTIGRATADNPLGPWTVDPEPVLVPDGTPEETSVLAPSVLPHEDGYIMYYAAVNEDNAQYIRRATSEDGIMWEKDADTILSPSEEWEGSIVHQPRVVHTGDNWLMIYRSQGSGSTTMRLSAATSTDGLMWEKSALNPVFQPRDIPGMYQFWYHAIAYTDETLYLYVEATNGNATDIYALTAPLSALESD
jgi:predicted GH43/DUF377 family glycosyl hydrolase